MAKRRQKSVLPKKKGAEGASSGESGRFGLGKPLSDYKTRSEREAEIQRMVIWAVGIAIGIVVILLAYALISDQIINPGRTVATVNGVEISADDFRNRVRFERLVSFEKINTAGDAMMQSQGLSEIDAINQALSADPALGDLYSELTNNDLIGLRVLDTMIADELARQEAAERGITVTQEEIDHQIETLLGFDSEANALALDPERTPEVQPTDTPSPTPFVSPTPRPTETPLPESTAEATAEATEEPAALPTVSAVSTRAPAINQQVFENNLERFYDSADSAADYSSEQVNAYFELLAIREKLADEVLENPGTELWVNARRIIVSTEEEAQQVLDALNAGESFADLAATISIDTRSSTQGGEMGALPPGGAAPFTPEFLQQQLGIDLGYLEAIGDGQPGELIGPINAELQDGTLGYQVLQIISREDRDLEDEQASTRKVSLLEEWLKDLRAENSATIETSDIWPDIVPSGPFYSPRGV